VDVVDDDDERVLVVVSRGEEGCWKDKVDEVYGDESRMESWTDTTGIEKDMKEIRTV
jgi:hypothetical protein